jgi:hypothetical protein
VVIGLHAELGRGIAMNTKEIAENWHYGRACITRPKMQEACDLILSMCVEIDRLNKEVEREKARQDDRDRKNKEMVNEVQNTIRKYA